MLKLAAKSEVKPAPRLKTCDISLNAAVIHATFRIYPFSFLTTTLKKSELLFFTKWQLRNV